MRPREEHGNQRTVKRTCPGDLKYGSWMKSLRPEVIIENTSSKANELKEGQQGTAGAAAIIVHTFISSQACLLMVESTPCLLKSATCTADLSPLLSTAGHCWKAIEMSVQQVGVFNQEENTRRLCLKPSKRGGTPH